jgi:hypothetical protein
MIYIYLSNTDFIKTKLEKIESGGLLEDPPKPPPMDTLHR